jgi:sentrin-specific protease 8
MISNDFCESNATDDSVLSASALFQNMGPDFTNYNFCLLDHDVTSFVNEKEGMNDELMDFWWDHLLQANPDLQESANGLIFLSPSVVHLIDILGDDKELNNALEDLNLREKGLVMLPINDHPGLTPGGTHWALLCYNRSMNHFRFYDSLNDRNLDSAMRVAERLLPILGSASGSTMELLQPPPSASTTCQRFHSFALRPPH